MNANFEKHILQTAIASNISGYAIGLKDNDPLKTIFTHLAQRLLTMKPDIFAYMKILDELNHLNVSTKSTKLFSNRTMTFKDRLLKKTKKVYSSIHSEALPTSTSGDDKEYMDALKKPISIEKNHHLAELTSLYAKLYELAGFKWVHTYSQIKLGRL